MRVAEIQPLLGQPMTPEKPEPPMTLPVASGVVVFFTATFFAGACIVLSTRQTLPEGLKLLVVYGEIAMFAVMFCSIAYLAYVQWVITAHRSDPILREGKYDPARYKRFRDYLDAVSLGAGVERPDLVVTKLDSPLAYVHPSRGIAITKGLLDADIEDAHVESIMAVLLARKVLGTGEAATKEAFAHRADEIGLNEYLVETVRSEFCNDSSCLFHLLADTYAARLIGQPDAIASAIVEADRMLVGHPKRPSRVEPRLIFVEPPLAFGESSPWSQRWMLPGSLESYNGMRQRVIDLRLENLRMLDFGKRQPHEEVRGGIPVTQPEGWE